MKLWKERIRVQKIIGECGKKSWEKEECGISWISVEENDMKIVCKSEVLGDEKAEYGMTNERTKGIWEQYLERKGTEKGKGEKDRMQCFKDKYWEREYEVVRRIIKVEERKTK